jgi:hypothetical protein
MYYDQTNQECSMNEFNITIVFDSLPNSVLYPNRLRCVHWSVRSKIEKQERELAHYRGVDYINGHYPNFQEKMGLPTLWHPFKKAILSFKFYSRTKRVRDLDGLIGACKPWIDGLVSSGILKADDCWHLSYGSAEVILAKQDETWLEIREI